MKVVIIFNQFGPYHYARLNAVGKQLDVYAIELFKTSIDYEWETSFLTENLSFKKVTLFEKENILSVSKKNLREKIFEALKKIDPDVVAINGWSESGAFAALKWCILNKTPAVVMSESTEFDMSRIRVKEAIKQQVVQKFSSALVGGKAHASYIHKLGIPINNIFQKYDVIDNRHFFQLAQNAKANSQFYYNKLSLPEHFFLASARFIPKKNLVRLLEAFAIYKEKLKPKGWNLVILGDGEMRSSLQSLIIRLGIRDSVFLPGFKQYFELPFYYGLAKAFIHPSTSEQWGLVVNEAMASGLPILLSSKCGCAEDLLQDGQNGFLFDPFNIQDMADKMFLLASDDNNLIQMSQQSLKIISNFTPEHFAEGLNKAVTSAISIGEKKYRFSDLLLLNFLSRQ
jgi:1,2-diacylglycerol 3-alpha-glucosyltransferase